MHRPQSPDVRETLASQVRLICRIALVAMIPLVTFFTTVGTFHVLLREFGGGWSSHFFVDQADAMIHGHLYVDRGDIQAECFVRDDRCYGYFGITPSVLRLPLYVKGRWFRSGLTPVYVAVALLLAYWAALSLLQRSLRKFADPAQPRAPVLWYVVAAALVLGPGGTLLFLARPAVYEEAAAWGVAFILLALDRVWAWHETGRRRSLIFAVIFAVAAANARPTGAIAAGVLGLVVAALWWFRDAREIVRPSSGKAFVYVAAICLTFLPAVTAGGVYWLKFGMVIPDFRLNEQIAATPWWRDVLQKNGDRTGGLMFLPTELVAYLRPDAVRLTTSEWPYFDFRFPSPDPILWVPPLPKGGAYVEHFTSLTATMPLSWVLNPVVGVSLAIAGWRLIRRRDPTPPRPPLLMRGDWILAAGSLATAAAMPFLVVTTVGITNRYLCDFFAISVVGVALGHRVLLPLLNRRPGLMVPLGSIALLLIVWSVLVTLSLTCRLVLVA